MIEKEGKKEKETKCLRMKALEMCLVVQKKIKEEIVCVCVCVYVCLCLCVCECVCRKERERREK